MAKYITKRVIYMVITLFIIISATFFLMKMMPGSPPFNNIGGKLTVEQEAFLMEQYGLDEPVPVQYVKYITGIFRGDLGVSFQYDNRPVTDIILDRIGPSAT